MQSRQEKRILFSLHWPQLAQLVDLSWADAAVLQAILAELKYRKSKGSRDLRSKVAVRLTELSAESFLWPETAIMQSETALNPECFWQEQGLLRFMGYAVGQKGCYTSERQHILDYVYNERVPNVFSPSHMREWGGPKTGKRLRKLANCLAAFTRNAKRHQFSKMQRAISEWENDLAYLKREYYDGKHDFIWPDT